MKACAIELGQFNIRVNSVHPTNVSTDMLLRNPPIQELMTGDPSAGRDDLAPALSGMHVISIPWVEAEDVSNLVVWLASDESRYVTGTTQVLDAGALAPFKISR
jgi:(+)-trans-carveol dehydrogenase